MRMDPMLVGSSAGRVGSVGLRGRMAGVLIAVFGLWLVVGVSVGRASTTSVYFDSPSDNISIDPNPFGGQTPPGGTDNTELGLNGLENLTSGSGNVAGGLLALASNTTGNFNVATGTDALLGNTNRQQ